jgi:arginyl-tRNA synthetase
VIPADLGAELARAISDLVAAGALPAGAVLVSSLGTWRPAPGRPAGTYATSLPFALAPSAGLAPVIIAAQLGQAVGTATWITSAEPTGGGYLNIRVTAAALAQVAVTVARAGPGCARSDALRGVRRPMPPLPDLAAQPDWKQAWQAQAAAVAGRLAAAAGATAAGATATTSPEPELSRAARPAARADGGAAGQSLVADAVDYAGADVVRYWLAAMPAGRTRELGREISVSRDLADPCCGVCFAAADAASVLRWAADLGIRRSEPDWRLPELLAQPAELALLMQLSWLAERVAGAARRGRPAELPRYLEELAAAWLTCRESCPALPFGGQAALPDPAGISARLWLADATATALAAGLNLIGIMPR